MKDELILNMTIFIKNHYAFYMFWKSIKDKYLDVVINVY